MSTTNVADLRAAGLPEAQIAALVGRQEEAAHIDLWACNEPAWRMFMALPRIWSFGAPVALSWAEWDATARDLGIRARRHAARELRELVRVCESTWRQHMQEKAATA